MMAPKHVRASVGEILLVVLLAAAVLLASWALYGKYQNGRRDQERAQVQIEKQWPGIEVLGIGFGNVDYISQDRTQQCHNVVWEDTPNGIVLIIGSRDCQNIAAPPKKQG